MERSHYAIGAALLQACTVGAPQQRERLYFVARASGARLPLPEQETVRGARGGGRRGEQLPNAVGGPVNPLWCAWLMGYPAEWVNCAPLATPSSRRSRQSSSGRRSS
jgi:site-specific DNA-cytosine methylase